MATAAKNIALSPAAQDLGLGDQLKQQLDDNAEQRRKKLLQQAQQLGGFSLPTSPAATMLGIPNA